MSRYGDEVDGGSCAIALAIFTIFATVIAVTIYDAVRESRFDKDFRKGEITFDANLIPLGSSGIPAVSTFPEWVPEGGEKIYVAPRIYEILGCEGFSLPDETKGVFASTTFFKRDLIEIDVPKQPSGYLNVCVPQGTKIEVVLWIKK